MAGEGLLMLYINTNTHTNASVSVDFEAWLMHVNLVYIIVSTRVERVLCHNLNPFSFSAAVTISHSVGLLMRACFLFEFCLAGKAQVFLT